MSFFKTEKRNLMLWDSRHHDPAHSATLLPRQRPLQCLHVPRLRPPPHARDRSTNME